VLVEILNVLAEVELAEMAKRQSKPVFTAEIRYDPNNLGRIWVCDPTDEKRWIEVPCQQFDYANGLTLTQHKYIRSQLVEILNRENADSLYRKKKAALRELVKESKSRGILLKKELKKMIDLQKAAPDNIEPNDDGDLENDNLKSNESLLDEDSSLSDAEIPIFATIDPNQFPGWIQ